jgi:uncharacterized phage protein (TIGR02218 family)
MSGIVDGEVTNVALCWRAERSDGAGLGLTSHDRAILSDGITYLPSPGMIPASITRSLGLEPHSAEASGALSSDALEPSDLALGRWDGARVCLSAIDWTLPVEDQIALMAGELGDVAIDGDSFSAELRGAAARLEGPVCPATSAECRAQFGDKQCRIDLAGRTIIANVLSSSDGQLTLDRAVDERYLLGRLRYMSGANCGLSSVVISVNFAVVVVRDLPRAPVEDGCRIALREGCDKRFQTCVERFANAINFRGEPHLPGNDLLTRYPGA